MPINSNVGLRAKLSPSFDERQTKKEIRSLEDAMDKVEELDLDVDVSKVEDKLEGVSGKVGGGSSGKGPLSKMPDDVIGGAGGSGGSDALSAAAGGRLGGGATGGLTGKLKGAGKALLPVAIAGAVGLGILKGVQKLADASPHLQKVSDMFGTAMMLFFRPFGQLIAEALQPFAKAALKTMVKFNEVFHDKGLMVAITWLSSSVEDSLKGGLSNMPTDISDPTKVLEDLKWGDFVTILDWAKWLHPLQWYNWATTLVWDNWLSKLTWDDWVNVLEWFTWISPVRWYIFISKLSWDHWLSDVNWGRWVPNVRWGQWIPHLNWGDWISVPGWLKGNRGGGGGSGGGGSGGGSQQTTEPWMTRGRVTHGGSVAEKARLLRQGSTVGLASGGLVTRPTEAIIGESGPEAVLPLDDLRQMMGSAAQRGAQSASSGDSSSLSNNAREGTLGDLKDGQERLIRAVRNLGGETRVEIGGDTLVRQEQKSEKRYAKTREITK